MSVDAIAAELKTAFENETSREALIPYFAPTIAYHHVPAFDSDGPRDGKEFGEYVLDDSVAQILGGFHRRLDRFRVDGDLISADIALTGTMPDGTALNVPLTEAFTVKDDKIVRMDMHFEESSVQELRVATTAYREAQSGSAPERTES
jgi:hypothetical protein